MQNDDLTKPWYVSQTIWGGVAAVLAGAGSLFYAAQAHDIPGVVAAMTAGWGGVTAIVGRLKATTVIGPANVVRAVVPTPLPQPYA